MNFRQSRNCAEHHILDARLRGRGDRDRIAVAPEACGDPQDMDFFNRRLVLAYPLAPLGLHSPPVQIFGSYGVHDDLP